MSHFAPRALSPKHRVVHRGRVTSKLPLLTLLLFVPLATYAQGSPFDNGFTALQTLFTGTVAKVAMLPIQASKSAGV
jgi:type IV secretion system protein VirB2